MESSHNAATTIPPLSLGSQVSSRRAFNYRQYG